jgi:hypothetical protein
VIAKFPTVCSLYAILPRCLVDRPLASSRRFANNLPLFPVDFRSVFSHRFSVFLAQISNYAVIVQYNTHRNPFLIPPAIRALPPITCCAPHNFGHFLSEPSILRSPCFSLYDALSILVTPFRSRAIPFENRSRLKTAMASRDVIPLETHCFQLCNKPKGSHNTET